MVVSATRFPNFLRFVAPVIATGIAYFIAAFGSLYLTRTSDGIAALWPASGVMLAILITVPKKHLGWHILAAAIASLAANLDAGNSLRASIPFTLANVSEAAIAAWLLHTRAKCKVSFVKSDGLMCFCKAALIATTISAVIGTFAGPVPSVRFWLSWFLTDLLGMLIVTPIILIVGRSLVQKSRPATAIPALTTAAMFVLVAVFAGLSFGQSSYPLLFVPMLAVLLAVYKSGPLGAAGGVLIVAIISSSATASGSGPVTLIRAGALERSLFLQFYLLTLFAASLPIATLLAARDRLITDIAGRVRLLELAESAAHVGHWRLDTRLQAITWSQEVFRIHGIEGDTPPTLDQAIEAYHPDDRPRVIANIENALANNVGFEFKARIIRPDGEVCHVFSHGEIDQDSDGSHGLFGVIRDITTQVAHETMMEEARIRAEEAAQRAKVLAETDPLTGIANRRRTTMVLDQAVHVARKAGRPVSIAMFDIDHFKRINDTYGHQTGDEVLKRVASQAASGLRSGDTIGRIGGEEFVIVLPDAMQGTALRVAERVRTAIAANLKDPPVSISVGVAELKDGEAPEAILRRADEALYVAKNEGRNTVRSAP